MPFSLEISRDAEHCGEVANVVTPVLIAIQEVLVRVRILHPVNN